MAIEIQSTYPWFKEKGHRAPSLKIIGPKYKNVDFGQSDYVNIILKQSDWRNESNSDFFEKDTTSGTFTIEDAKRLRDVLLNLFPVDAEPVEIPDSYVLEQNQFSNDWVIYELIIDHQEVASFRDQKHAEEFLDFLKNGQ